MGRRARALMLLAGIGAALAACNLLTGLDADFKLGMDAAVTGGEGGPDGDGPDGDKPDGSTDGPITTDAEAGPNVRYCDTIEAGPANDFLCDDFEDGDVNAEAGTATKWDEVRNIVAGGSGTIAIVNGAGIDGTRGLDVRSTGTGARQTRLYKVFNPTLGADQYLAYELDFDFRLDNSNLGYEAFGLVLFTPSAATEEHGVAGHSANPYRLARPALPGNPPLTKWHSNQKLWMHARIRLTHATAGAPFTRTITIDTVDVDGAPNGNHVVPSAAPTEVTVGVFNSNNAGTAHVQFDNVVFRRRP